MKLKNILSIVLGFGTIGLLSSIFAKIQGYIYPNSLDLFNNTISGSLDVIQYVIKILCVFVSCFIGGFVSTILKGEKRELLIIAGGITVVIGWLWLSVGQPFWFWLFLVLGNFPLIFLGSRCSKIWNNKQKDKRY